MTHVSRALVLPLVIALFSLPQTAHAGPTDTPLPTFSDGKPSMRVYNAVGVIKANNLQTDFICTNLDSAPVDIGVEVFDETGALRNSIAADNGAFLNVGPGKTVTGGTGSTVVVHEDKTITLNAGGNGVDLLRNGSGRIVATSKSIACTALIIDKLHAIVDPTTSSLPPPPFTNLPLIRVP